MKRKSLFRQSLFLGILIFGSISQAGEILNEIEAHQFQSTPVQISRSGRVYLFKTDAKDLPWSGSVLLVHDQKKPAMAFRVLRTDSSRSEFVAKKIRRYDKTAELALNQGYFTLEKVSDVLSGPETNSPTEIAKNPPETSPIPVAVVQDQKAPVQKSETKRSEEKVETTPTPTPTPEPEATPTDTPAPAPVDDALDSPEKKPEPSEKPQPRLNVETFDQDLDGTTSPRNMKKESGDSSDDDEPSVLPNEVNETLTFNPYDNSLSFMFGLFKNLSGFVLNSGNASNAFLLDYSHTLGKDLFANGKTIQDSLNIEGGLGYYSLVNTAGQNDQYKVMPIQAQLRYDLQFSRSFGLLFYGGLQVNAVIGKDNPNEKTTGTIQGIQQTLGVGFLFTLGPHWYLRTELGWDKLALGLALEW